jgi:hypothetical protein
MYYNFARVHQTLRVTPAMEAGVADHVWTINEVVALPCAYRAAVTPRMALEQSYAGRIVSASAADLLALVVFILPSLLAAGTLIVAIASTAWWLSSPQGLRRTGEAIVFLVGAVCCVGHCRRLPPASPAVLFATVLGGVALIEKPGGPLFPIALAVLAGLTWTGVVVVRSAGPYVRRKTVGSAVAQLVGRRRMLRYSDQDGFPERHTVPRCEH